MAAVGPYSTDEGEFQGLAWRARSSAATPKDVFLSESRGVTAAARIPHRPGVSEQWHHWRGLDHGRGVMSTNPHDSLPLRRLEEGGLASVAGERIRIAEPQVLYLVHGEKKYAEIKSVS